MAGRWRRDPEGPERASRLYWRAAYREVRQVEASLFELDEQLAVLEQECGCPRPKKKRLAPPQLRRLSSRQALQDLAQSTARHAVRRRQIHSLVKAIRRREPAGKRSLTMLHVSPRYGKVNAKLLGIQRTRNMKQKIAQGRYIDTMGQFKQGKYRADLQKAPERTGMPLQQFSLVAWDRRRQGGQAATYVGPDSSISTLRVNLWCTQRDADCLFDWCHWFSRRSKPGPKSGLTAETPYPTFIPSKGRAKSAHLNWSAPHCFGKELFEGMPEAAESPNALVVAVVEPAEAAAYRDAWPDVPLFVLPENDMGPSFARWAVQKLCTAFRTEEMEDLGPLHHLPFCWLVDDSITSFYSLEKLSSKSLAEEQGRLQERGAIVASSPLSRPSGRRTERCAQGAMFAKAFLTLQRQAASASYAVAGFLRDDGTAPMKCAQWALDNTSVFKVVLLNLEHLWELRVEYIPQLRLFEDVCLNVQARNSGGHILKCQTFCYRADNKTYGGCSDLRAAKAAANHCTLLEDLLPSESFLDLSAQAKAAVQHVYSWVHRDEDKSRRRMAELGLEAPLPAPELAQIPLMEPICLDDLDDLDDLDEDLEIVEPEVRALQNEASWGSQLKVQRLQMELD